MLQQCQPLWPKQQPDDLWVALPNMQRYRVSLRSPLPAQWAHTTIPPGAWVWAPDAGSGLRPATSALITQLLATQTPPAELLPMLGAVKYGVNWIAVSAPQIAQDTTPNTPLESHGLWRLNGNWEHDQSAPASSEPLPKALWSLSQQYQTAWSDEANHQTGWLLRAEYREGDVLNLVFDTADNASSEAEQWDQRSERLLQLLHNSVTPEIQRFEVVLMANGLPIRRALFEREEWAAQHNELIAPSLRLRTQTPMPLRLRSALSDKTAIHSTGSIQLTPGLDAYQSTDDAAWRYAFHLNAQSKWSWGQGLGLQAALQLPLVSTQPVPTAPNLPPLLPTRTVDTNHWPAGRLRFKTLALTKTRQWSPQWVTQSYVGWLDATRAGVGVATAYRPTRANWSLTTQVNHLVVRPSAQSLSTASAGLTTGLLGASWSRPNQDWSFYGFAGRFLAGDRGYTVGAAKAFPSGIEWSAELTHSRAATPLISLRFRVPFDSLNRNWRWGGLADLQMFNHFSDRGARLQAFAAELPMAATPFADSAK